MWYVLHLIRCKNMQYYPGSSNLEMVFMLKYI
jgi:hypothetical protein